MNEEEQSHLFHIIWVTHNSRVSERMKKFSRNKGLQPLVLDEKLEIEVTSYIAEIVIEDKYQIIAYNICGDHVHMIMYCEDKKRDNIIRKLKGKSAQKFKQKRKIETPFHLGRRNLTGAIYLMMMHWKINIIMCCITE